MRLLPALFAAFFSLSCFGGGGGGGSGITGSVYKPTGLGQADTNWQQLFGNLMANLTGPSGTQNTNQMISQAQTNLNPIDLYGSPYLAAMTAAGNQAGQQYGGLAQNAINTGNVMQQAGGTDLGVQTALDAAGSTAWNTALDPQQALYQRTAQQVQDQSRANTAAAGLGTSPYAAGLENQAASNFNIDWQNQQLQRQLEGLSGLGTAAQKGAQIGAAGTQNLTGAQAMMAMSPQDLLASANVPYQQATAAASGPINEANALTQAQQADVWNPVSSLLNQLIPYMNFGTGAQMNAFNAGQSNLGNLIGLGGLGTNMYGMGSGTGFGALGNLFGNIFGGAGAGAATDAGIGAATDAGIGALALA